MVKFYQKIERAIGVKALTLTLLCTILLSATGLYAQTINLSAKQKSLKELFRMIEDQTSYKFLYNSTDFDDNREIDFEVTGGNLEETLTRILSSQGLEYTIRDNHILVTVQPRTVSDPANTPRQVSGIVRNEAGELLVGVNVFVKGNQTGTATGIDGSFSLRVPGTAAILVFSYLGYDTQEITVGGRTSFNIVMYESSSVMEELVVVGYGVQKKGNLAAAVSRIKDEEIMSTTHTSLAQRLQGKVPGLQIRQNTGAPGDFDAMINVRGFGSPIFIVDRITRLDGGEFQRLNPEDIDNITVLKDGSAAIYGMDAANGVVLVTTKRGTEGRTRFSYNGSLTFSKPTDIPKMANAYQWMVIRNDAAVNVGKNPLYTREELKNWRTGAPGYQSTDWYGETMKKSALAHQHSVTAQGGTERVNYFLSFGYMKDDGMLKTNATNYERYSIRSNITAQLHKNIRADVDLSGWYGEQSGSRWSFMEIIRGTISQQPMKTPYANNDPDYPAYVYDGQAWNPVVISDPDIVGYTRSVNKSFKGSASLTYSAPFLQGLELKGIAYYEHGNATGKSLSKSYTMYSYDASQAEYVPFVYGHPTVLNTSWSDGNGVMLQAMATFNRTFASVHNVGATAVYEERKGWSKSGGMSREFQYYTVDQIDMGDETNMRNSGMESESANKALVGRLTYNYDNKYMVEVAARYDGSYRYHPDKRWGLFPVFQAGWRMSEESFIKDNLPFVSNLKLRGSYGIVGINAGDAFQYYEGYQVNVGGYEFADGVWTNGIAAPVITNKNLTYYKSNIKNVGIEIGLFRSSLAFEMDVYQRDQSGLLAYRNASITNTFGASMPQENLNKDRVRGIEFGVGYTAMVTPDLRINVGANFNFARRMVVYEERGAFTNSMERWRSGQSGRWSDIVWMYDYIGQFQSEEEILHAAIQNGTLGNSRELPGDFRYRDVNGDGVIDGNDMIPLEWGGDPKLFYGFMVGARWKFLDFYMLWQGAGKYSVMFTHNYATMFWNDGNHPAYFYDRWHLADQFDPDSEWIAGKWPAARLQSDVGAMYNESSVWRKDASYIRLKSLEIGYTLPRHVLQGIGIQQLRIYVSGNNLLTLCDKFVKPFDPERIAGTYNAGWVYPLQKSFNIGINLSF